MTFSEYLEDLCRRHRLVKHSDDEVHFSDLADDAQNKYAHSMNYPCVVLDEGDFDIRGAEGQPEMVDVCSVLFLTHVRDSADADEVKGAFALTRRICLDFLKKFVRDRKAGTRPLTRFKAVGSQGTRIYLQDAGLYGYILMFEHPEIFIDKDCDNSFEE